MLAGKIKPGDAVLCWVPGTEGAPGMPEIDVGLTCILAGMGLSDSVALVTDGRFSVAQRPGRSATCALRHMSEDHRSRARQGCHQE